MLAKHLRCALGSVGELETQIELAVRLEYFTERDVRIAVEQLKRSGQLLHGTTSVGQPLTVTGITVLGPVWYVSRQCDSSSYVVWA